MRPSGSSYIGRRPARQSLRPVRTLAIAVLAAWLGGCTALGLPFGTSAVDRGVTTGGIAKVSSKSTGSVEPSDWEAVRSAMARAAADGTLEKSLDWRNPKTGTTGTVRILDTVTAANDPNCRNFETTLNDMRGIRHYRGEACLIAKGRWQLFGVMADDSQLL